MAGAVDDEHGVAQAGDERHHPGPFGLRRSSLGLEIDGQLLELHAARLEVVVGRIELLDGRLELLVERLELLVRRLQLLVERLDLLGRRLDFLVGDLEFLVGAPKLGVRCGQLVVRHGDPAVGLAEGLDLGSHSFGLDTLRADCRVCCRDAFLFGRHVTDHDDGAHRLALTRFVVRRLCRDFEPPGVLARRGPGEPHGH